MANSQLDQLAEGLGIHELLVRERERERCLACDDEGNDATALSLLLVVLARGPPILEEDLYVSAWNVGLSAQLFQLTGAR